MFKILDKKRIRENGAQETDVPSKCIKGQVTLKELQEYVTSTDTLCI